MHLRPHLQARSDAFHVYLSEERGDGTSVHHLARLSCTVIPPVSFPAKVLHVTCEAPQGTAEIQLPVRVAKNVCGEPQVAARSPQGVKAEIIKPATLRPGDTSPVRVRLEWNLPAERKNGRIWVCLVGFDDSLQCGSAWIILDHANR